MADQTQKQFYIIMGRPGSGKGTQAELLKAYLEPTHKDVIHVTTGGSFREFITKESFFAQQAKEIQNTGGLQPEFLSVWNWTNVFIDQLKEGTTVILDGAPRKIVEQSAMHELFGFAGYGKPYVIYINVSDAWALDRQNYRQSQTEEKRLDSASQEDMKKRLELFDLDILPCIDTYSHDPRYAYIHVNGEQTIEEVHKEIIEKINAIRN